MRIKRVSHYVLRDYRSEERLSDATEASGADEEDKFNNLVAFTCLLPHPDGKLYCGITCYNTDILHRFDPETNAFHQMGPIIDSESGLKLYRVHDIRLMEENLAYVAETDVPNRSGYLWECELEV